jgi:MoxR-like ATPase
MTSAATADQQLDAVGALPPGVTDPAGLAAAMSTTGYLADPAAATACFLALKLGKPLFLEGAAGVGKTSMAHSLSELLDVPLIRLQCYEGIDASQALYEWDFPRQLLHVRAAQDGARDAGELEAELYARRFLLTRPILAAVEQGDAVLLIDEVDRADDEFEAFLLETLSDFTVSIPELGTIAAARRPTVVLTSNRTREVHDALKRRCYYLFLDHPDLDRELDIVGRRLPHVPPALARQVVAAVHRMRELDLLKPPGVAETLDWSEALTALDTSVLTETLAEETLGAVVKYHEDQELVRQALRAGTVIDDDAAPV